MRGGEKKIIDDNSYGKKFWSVMSRANLLPRFISCRDVSPNESESTASPLIPETRTGLDMVAGFLLLALVEWDTSPPLR